MGSVMVNRACPQCGMVPGTLLMNYITIPTLQMGIISL